MDAGASVPGGRVRLVRRAFLITILIAAVVYLLLLFLPVTGIRAMPLSTPAPSLNAEASLISGKQLEVRCYSVDPADQDPDAEPDAWGYVFLMDTTVFLDKRACDGAEALQTGAMLPLWQLALGALVLTHESYHLKTALPDVRRANEAQTECRAIKRVPQTLLDLGANVALATQILPWALAEHYRISTIRGYGYPSCNVPGFEWWK